MSDDKQSLLGMTLNELKEAVRELGMPAFTGVGSTYSTLTASKR